MERDVIETKASWRAGLAAVGLFLLAGVAVNVATVVRGDWEWDSGGIVLAFALGMLAMAAVVGNAFAWTTRVYVDPHVHVLHFSTLGRSEVRRLGVGSTVRLRKITALPTVRVFTRWDFLVDEPGEALLTISTPWLGSPQRLAGQLQRALGANPELAADERTRDWLEQPQAIT